MKRLGILLTVSAEATGFSEMKRFLSSVSEDSKVYFYAIDEGVLALEKIRPLSKPQWHLYGCAYSARQRGVELDSKEVIFCGLSVLADILGSVEEMVAVTAQEPFLSVSSKEINVSEKRRVLVEIVSDPRINPKAAEGIRMAAGIQVWERVKMEVGLSGEGVYCLAADKQNLEGAETLGKELLLLKGGVWAKVDDLEERKISLPSKIEKLSPEEVLRRRNRAWLRILS